MSPKTRPSIILAALAVGIAAIAGIAGLQGWIPGIGEDPPPGLRIVPPESLSPGETVMPERPPAKPEVTAEVKPEAKSPPKLAPAPSPSASNPVPGGAPPSARAAEPRPKPAPRPPTYAQAPSPSRLCANCGTVDATTWHERGRFEGAWEVRVRFDDGSRRILRFPADPGFRVGDRVFFSKGRLHRD